MEALTAVAGFQWIDCPFSESCDDIDFLSMVDITLAQVVTEGLASASQRSLL